MRVHTHVDSTDLFPFPKLSIQLVTLSQTLAFVWVIGLPMTTPQRRQAATVSNPPAQLLVLGIVMSEKTYTSRNRWLRAYYSDPLVNSGSAVLVRFVVDANWWARRIVEDPSSASDDVLGVMTMSELPQRHCAHKMVGWW